jgi:hypothetical protein
MKFEEQPLIIQEASIKLAKEIKAFFQSDLKGSVKIEKNTVDYIEIKDFKRIFYFSIKPSSIWLVLSA